MRSRSTPCGRSDGRRKTPDRLRERIMGLRDLLGVRGRDKKNEVSSSGTTNLNETTDGTGATSPIGLSALSTQADGFRRGKKSAGGKRTRGKLVCSFLPRYRVSRERSHRCWEHAHSSSQRRDRGPPGASCAHRERPPPRVVETEA